MNDQPLKDLLDILLSRLKVDTNDNLADMRREWMEIVGPDIAPHTKIFEIRRSVLVVECDHPAWSSTLLMKKKQILARIATQYPGLGITGLSVKSMR
jgi:predicted nucleic acid-binding Zn ribbon protein